MSAVLGLTRVHFSAREVVDILSPEQFVPAFKFAFVRNPWDRLVSQYHYRRSLDATGLRSQNIGFQEWVCRAYGDRDPALYNDPRYFRTQCDWICDEFGSLLVDFVGRFETLEADFRTVAGILGSTASLPHHNASEHEPYRRYYDHDTCALVRDYFAPDLATFGYEF